MKTNSSMVQTEVLIVGAGPAGATTALALANYGIATICLSKYSSTSQSPRAHITNQRTMEILRHFGLEADAMALATPHHLMREHIYMASLTGPEYGRLEAWHTHPRFQAQHDLISPCSMVDLTQDLLEPVIVAGAMRGGARIRFDTELMDFEQDDEGVTATVKDLITGELATIRSRYLVGADGANSRVVEKLGLPLEGKMGFAGNIGIGFKADLRKFTEHRAGVMYWIVQPGEGIAGYPIGALRMVRAFNRWIATWGYNVEKGPPRLSNAEAIDIVHRVIGDATIPVEIERISPWSMNRVYATEIARERVFCMGDAIHRHTPMNGLGTNTSIQDGFNLAWKLALVLRGQAGPGLLESYQQERQPVAKRLVERTTDNFRVYIPVAQSLGFAPGHQPPEAFAAVPDKLTDASPEGIARRARLREAIAENIDGFGALGGEHNQFYQSSAIIEDSRKLSVENPDLDVILGAEAGRRLPHLWLTERQKRVSTLDLCTRGRFTLLTGIAGAAWRDAALSAGQALGLDIQVHIIGPAQRFEDAYGDFARLCLPDETGALLIRPDLYLAWRVPAMPEDPAHELSLILSRLLDRTATSSLPLTEPERIGEAVQ